MIKVSVIVPIYNAEKYMSKCIDSILGQTLKDIEIILINDGSSDSSGKIADSYAEKDSRVKVVHQKNSGPSKARNVGMRIAKGKYLGFVDSDDYIEANMYEELYNLANEKRIKVAMCNYKEIHVFNNTSLVITNNLESNRVYDSTDIKKEIVSTFTKSENYGYFSFWNKIYLKEWIDEVGINIDESRDHGEDWWFNINIFVKLDSFICTEKVFYNYVHINKNSLMVKYRENQFDLFLDGRKKLLSIIPPDLVDYNELNTRFIYEFSAYILRTLKEVNDKNKCRKFIMSVLKNEEVLESCKGKSNLPINYYIITVFIKNNMKTNAYLCYKLMNILIKMRGKNEKY